MKVSKIRDEIADYWHKRQCDISQVFPKKDSFAAFYTSKFLIQDSAESIGSHMVRGFSKDPWTAYLEFWGVMQAIIIQQDAICELHNSIVGDYPAISSPSSWLELRDLRNKCAGHPAKKTAKKDQRHYRTFMGRSFGNYESVTYEQYDSVSGKISHPRINLRDLIGKYDNEAFQYLDAILQALKTKCP